LGSLCLFLSAIEYLIPKPLPFMRIGLANLPLLLALNIFRAKDFFLLALLKVLGQGLIGGTLFSYIFLFSIAGTFASASVMFMLHLFLGNRHLGFAGLGCAGAMASNGIQLLLARYLVFGPALRYLAPPFLASGFITGIVLGLTCEYFCRRSRWYSGQWIASNETSPRTVASQETLPKQFRWDTLFRPDELFCAGLLMALIFLFSPALLGNRPAAAHAAQFIFFCLLARLSGKKINLLATTLFMAGIVFFNLLAPYGKVLAAFGPLRITQESLFAGLDKALILGGLLMLSRACIRRDLKLPGIGSLLGESLRILELMREKKNIIRRGHVIEGIDNLLLEMETIGIYEPNTSPGKLGRNAKSLMLLCGMITLTAVAGLLPTLLELLIFHS
jgi:heptaprenyl diphosphate synthase